MGTQAPERATGLAEVRGEPPVAVSSHRASQDEHCGVGRPLWSTDFPLGFSFLICQMGLPTLSSWAGCGCGWREGM